MYNTTGLTTPFLIGQFIDHYEVRLEDDLSDKARSFITETLRGLKLQFITLNN